MNDFRSERNELTNFVQRNNEIRSENERFSFGTIRKITIFVAKLNDFRSERFSFGTNALVWNDSIVPNDFRSERDARNERFSLERSSFVRWGTDPGTNSGTMHHQSALREGIAHVF